MIFSRCLGRQPIRILGSLFSNPGYRIITQAYLAKVRTKYGIRSNCSLFGFAIIGLVKTYTSIWVNRPVKA
jgi:hypothetical protein